VQGSVLADSIVKALALRTREMATAAAARHLNSSNIRSTARETSITVHPNDHRSRFLGMRIKILQPQMYNLKNPKSVIVL
jgi:hypothetical protein